jgi:lipopolysaccharide/colanic/teichoic acid biosynthesis glycosyltransferase
VGPRPHAVAHNDHYAELIRVSMRSGITSNRELQGGPRSEVTGAKLPPCAP